MACRSCGHRTITLTDGNAAEFPLTGALFSGAVVTYQLAGRPPSGGVVRNVYRVEDLEQVDVYDAAAGGVVVVSPGEGDTISLA